jgi:hypothetical protein
MVQVSRDFGIIVRKTALAALHIERTTLLKTMETASPFDEDGDLFSFGPHFGIEAATEFRQRLKELGLVEEDDFYMHEDSYPLWVQIAVAEV